MALWVHGFITFETCDLACSEIEKPGFYQFAEWQKKQRKNYIYLNLIKYSLRTCSSNFRYFFR